MTPGVMSLAQEMPVHDACVDILEEDFADDTITLCPSPLPPIEMIQVEGYSESEKEAGEPDYIMFFVLALVLGFYVFETVWTYK